MFGKDYGATGPSAIERFKQLDFFTKAQDDILYSRSRAGGVLTIFVVILLVYLVFYEALDFTRGTTEDLLTVDRRRGERLQINLDITFPSLSCEDTAVDVVDGNTGNTIRDATFQIYKNRLSHLGTMLVEGEQAKLGQPGLGALGVGKSCLPCTSLPFAGRPMPGRSSRPGRSGRGCCDTCAQVRQFCSTYNFPQSEADKSPQCKVEAPYASNEGCQIRGYLSVPRGKGDFHIAAGKGTVQSHDTHEHHVHQIDFGRLDKFNITHRIRHLSFGPDLPSAVGPVNPLNDHKLIANSLAQQTYFIQVVPTTYHTSGSVIESNQYSYTQHYNTVKLQQNSFALPGVYFKYDISPLAIQIQEKKAPLGHFLVRICAIIGGIYVALGIIYTLTSNVIKQTAKKRK